MSLGTLDSREPFGHHSLRLPLPLDDLHQAYGVQCGDDRLLRQLSVSQGFEQLIYSRVGSQGVEPRQGAPHGRGAAARPPSALGVIN